VKEIVVISGKGGTGKTSVVASFAALADRPVLADCDVDAADLHLVLSPAVEQQHEFSGGKRARVAKEKCTGCGMCQKLCRFGAITESTSWDEFPKIWYKIDPIACEGCGVCAWFCPEKAIDFSDAVNGSWFISKTRFGPMVHARLGVAEENSGKLVTLVRKNAKEIAGRDGHSCVIIDGSPGLGCPVIASITGASLVLIVAEPTLSGRHDMQRVAQLAKHFGIQTAICVNKADINEQIAEDILGEAKRRGLNLAGTIRYDTSVTKAQIAKAAVVEYSDHGAGKDIQNVWHNVRSILWA
jgi:MinD superfamily P-loop ATPase